MSSMVISQGSQAPPMSSAGTRSSVNWGSAASHRVHAVCRQIQRGLLRMIQLAMNVGMGWVFISDESSHADAA